MKRRGWTKAEDSHLIYFWGARTVDRLSKDLGRTIGACKKRMLKLTGSRSVKRGRITQAGLARETGYSISQIKRATRALGIDKKIDRTGSYNKDNKRGWDNRAWLISDRHKREILEWLRQETKVGPKKWCRGDHGEFSACKVCGTDEIPHKGKGMCRRCYSRLLQRERKRRLKQCQNKTTHHQA